MDDTPEQRQQSAQRYTVTIPVVNDWAEQLAAHFGDSPGRRAQLLDLLRPHQEAIETAHVEALVRHLSVEEIEALTLFQASPSGRAIMRKMAAIQADLFPKLSPLLQAVAEDAISRRVA